MTDTPMTDQPDLPERTLRLLSLAILLGAGVSAVVVPFLQWLMVLVLRTPIPPGAWVDFLVIRAVAGAGLGAMVYAARRVSHGWLRMCLYGISWFLLIGADIEAFVREPVQRFLSVWLVTSLFLGVIFGTFFHVMERRQRRRTVNDGQPYNAP